MNGMSSHWAQVWLFAQRAGHGQLGAVCWDYHVFALQRRNNDTIVWDLDRSAPRLSMPLVAFSIKCRGCLQLSDRAVRNSSHQQIDQNVSPCQCSTLPLPCCFEHFRAVALRTDIQLPLKRCACIITCLLSPCPYTAGATASACMQEVSHCAMATLPAALCIRQAAHAGCQWGMADAAAALELHLPSW
jgi:N-terminal glutamine amidase